MAQESCNLDKKEEAEILKPPTSPSSSASPPPPPLFMNSNNTSNNSLQEFSSKKLEKPEKTIREEGPSKPPPSIRLGNRCSSCRKRVGLTGFRCRCGELFCGKHRYSDVHDCSFDYKALGRQEISKANPLVRAAKIIKI